MRRDVILALFLASTSGLFAAIGAYNWMPVRQKTLVLKQEEPAIDLTTVVVAKKDVPFGTTVSADALQETKWPADNLPEGSYKTVSQFFGEQQNRVALEALHANEPILRGKVSGPGQRATLSNMLSQGMKAVSIKVNDVAGVGGFVMPGDFVDILLVVEERDADDRKKPKLPGFSDLLLERVRVLAVDQSFDLKQEQPKLGNTVTVEVALSDAQKIALAQSIGKLSLVLRPAAQMDAGSKARRLLVSDLGDSGDKAPQATFEPTNAVAEETPQVATSPGVQQDRPQRATAKINVVRTTKPEEYEVARSTPKD